MMYKLSVARKCMVRVLALLMAVGILSACEKKEQYAFVTINGVDYVEIRPVGIFEAPLPSIKVLENYNVALYHTDLDPLTGNYPSYSIDFWISLKDSTGLEMNKPYKIWGVKISGEYDWGATITRLRENIPAGYDGIAYCYKDGVRESFSLEGEFKLERYDVATGFYDGTYHLTHSSMTNEPLSIKGKFKAVEIKDQLTYPNNSI